MKTLFKIISFLLTQNLLAQGFDYTVNPEIIKKNFCTIENPGLINQVEVNIKPNFFFRYLTGKRLALFSSSEKQNYMINLDTRKLYKTPGNHDPVPFWGEDIVTVPRPVAFGGGGNAMQFYRIDDVLKGNSNPMPLLVDTELKGVYQSVGQIGPMEKNSYINRVLTDYKGISYRDYRVEKQNNQVIRVTALGPIKGCRNVDIKTPMISKNGTEVAGFDTKEGVTKIWKLDRSPHMNCSVIEKLPYSTGKVDFSFDGRYLAFHMNSSIEKYSGTGRRLFGRSRYDSRPAASKNTNIFVYDRITKELKQLTFNVHNNSYFPVWGKEGKVVFITYSGSGNMAFTESLPENSTAGQNNKNEICSSQSHEVCKDSSSYLKYVSTSMIGTIWIKLCTPVKLVNPQMALQVAKNIGQSKCKKMAQDLWWGENIDDLNHQMAEAHYEDSKMKKIPKSLRRANRDTLYEVLEKMSLENLLKACQYSKNDALIETPGPSIAPLEISKGAGLLVTKCMSCHSNLELTNLQKLKSTKAHTTKNLEGHEVNWAQAALIRINGQGGYTKMPMGESLSKNDLNEISNFLNGQK